MKSRRFPDNFNKSICRCSNVRDIFQHLSPLEVLLRLVEPRTSDNFSRRCKIKQFCSLSLLPNSTMGALSPVVICTSFTLLLWRSWSMKFESWSLEILKLRLEMCRRAVVNRGHTVLQASVKSAFCSNWRKAIDHRPSLFALSLSRGLTYDDMVDWRILPDLVLDQTRELWVFGVSLFHALSFLISC